LLQVSLQPLRINIDQDTLFFIIDFVNSLMPADEAAVECSPPPPRVPPTPAAANSPGDRSRSCSGGGTKFSSTMQAIRIEVPEGSEVYEDARGSPPYPDHAQLSSSSPRSKSSTPAPGGGGGSSTNSLTETVFIKSFLFAPAVPIRIDYVGKYVDLTQGALTGLLAGLAQLNCSEITLKQLELRQGILGLDRLFALVATAWLADIRSCQLPALLGGVGPMHALLQMAAGVRDLFLMPIEQYRKDGRIVRGLQKGTTSFTHSTTLSLLDMTNKLLSVVKFAAELAFDVMSPEGCVVQGKLPHPAQYCRRRVGRAGLRRARGTPHDMREGMLGAMALVREGLDETARSLAMAAGERGMVGGVLRAVPSTMVRPVILGAAATSNLLDGVKNQISPDQRIEEEDKWRTHPH
jgi:autophagy-related protein 2